MEDKESIVKFKKNRILKERWKIGEQFTNGGNSSLFYVTDLNDEQESYVLKRFLPNQNSKEKYERFVLEIKIGTRQDLIDDLYVIPILDSSIDEETYENSFFIMPVCGNYSEIIRDSIFIKCKGIIHLFEILEHLHSMRIAHRDIKPEIILKYKPKSSSFTIEEDYYFGDFGLVIQNEQHNLTSIGERIGSRNTIAPEMLSDPISANPYKADVYSLAKTIWGLLIGDVNCFPGVYSRDSSVSWDKHDDRFAEFSQDYLYKDRNLTYGPLHEMMELCTQNDPSLRPDVTWMKEKFYEWLSINNDFMAFSSYVWKESIHKLFPYGIPQRCKWTEIDDIVKTMRTITRYRNSNEVLLPRGNTTIESVEKEGDYLVFFASRIKYIFPINTLELYYVNDDYFWLILSSNSISTLFLEHTDDSKFEELLELDDGTIIPYNDESSFKYRICRYYSGELILVNKLFFSRRKKLEDFFRLNNASIVYNEVKRVVSSRS